MSDLDLSQRVPDNAPQPRLCHVTKWDHFDGYGFNLHAEKSKPGQFIGKVDDDSPAEAAGLKEGDRIIEVNGVNINHENHKQVVQRIKAIPNETTLLVVDRETEAYYRQCEIVVTHQLGNILRLSSAEDELDDIDGIRKHEEEEEQEDEVDEIVDRESRQGSSHSMDKQVNKRSAAHHLRTLYESIFRLKAS